MEKKSVREIISVIVPLGLPPELFVPDTDYLLIEIGYIKIIDVIKVFTMEKMYVNEKSYEVIKLLSHGKGGIHIWLRMGRKSTC